MPDLYFTSNVISVGLWKKDFSPHTSGQKSYDLRSVYVETFWLPILGPSTIFFLRFLARRFFLTGTTERFCVDLKETARCIGLSDRLTHNSPIIRTVLRCIDFNIAKIIGPNELLVCNFLPPLSQRHQNHLPSSLLKLHMALNDRFIANSHDSDSVMAKNRKTALRLLKMGLTEIDCEKNLLQNGVHPSRVREVVYCAKKQLQNLQAVH